MVFKPIENHKISSRIMEQIKDNILSGKLKVGDKLPSERELSMQLGVSRSSVREALRSLDILGVVVSVQGEGTYIQGNFQESLSMLMTFMYCMNGCRLTEALRLRESLEVSSIVQSASRWTEEDIVELEKYCNLLESEGSEEEKSEYDKAFHDKIAEMSGNSLILELLNAASYIIQHIIKSARERILFRECIDQVSKQHRNILEAIRGGNQEEIKKYMQEHMYFVSEMLQDIEETEK